MEKQGSVLDSAVKTEQMQLSCSWSSLTGREAKLAFKGISQILITLLSVI
jgi:hypothetical protein